MDLGQMAQNFFVAVVLVLGFCMLMLPSWRLIRSEAKALQLVPFSNLLVIFLLSALVTAALVALMVEVGHPYGYILFVFLPSALGFAGALLWLELGGELSRGGCQVASAAAVLGGGAGTLIFGLEGLICLVMATPLVVPLGLLGGEGVWRLRKGRGEDLHAPTLLLLLLVSAPVLMGAEAVLDPEPPLYEVRTAVIVDAPPEVVWRHVVSFSELPPPTELLFRSGIAYPIRAEIRGRGVGAVRYCVFSTGAFVEPIEVWDEPRLLRFSVTENPPSMRELSFYPAVHPPHLEGFMVSRRGQFLLEELPGGRTRLEGTTWYSHGLFPASYWRLWSDWILHRIHGRVLDHVRRLAERDVRGNRAAL